MTLPMRLSLAPSGSPDPLLIEPAGDIESLRHKHQRVDQISLPANEEVVLPDARGNCLEIQAEILPQGADVVELNVLRSPGKEEYTRLSIYPHGGYYRRDYPRSSGVRDSIIVLDNARASTLPDALPRPPEQAQFMLGKDEPIRLRIFIDRSVVEVFANGKQYLALRVYPGRDDSLGVSLRARGKDAQLASLDVWAMNSIYQSDALAGK